MKEVTVLVPEDRVPAFYAMVGKWLAGEDLEEVPNQIRGWDPTDDEDEVLAKIVYDKLSARGKAMFDLLIDDPDTRYSGLEIADKLEIPNGKYGVAGVLAWPGRHCAAVGRHLPISYEDGEVGESAKYWMDPEVADLFMRVRNGFV